ncbi:hypothetical protein [Salinicola lusitanus]|uniref:hypothetical protein n=1 Tax=Salinicola lusitanus TaxID=1949085 RepID=UPI000DA20CA4|nr:hypothetical protein [Salinicola lusitanus]
MRARQLLGDLVAACHLIAVALGGLGFDHGTLIGVFMLPLVECCLTCLRGSNVTLVVAVLAPPDQRGDRLRRDQQRPPSE